MKTALRRCGKGRQKQHLPHPQTSRRATQVFGVRQVFQYQTVELKLPFMYFLWQPAMRAF